MFEEVLTREGTEMEWVTCQSVRVGEMEVYILSVASVEMDA